MTRLLKWADFDGNEGTHHIRYAGHDITCYDHGTHIRIHLYSGDTELATDTIHDPAELTPRFIADLLYSDDQWDDHGAAAWFVLFTWAAIWRATTPTTHALKEAA